MDDRKDVKIVGFDDGSQIMISGPSAHSVEVMISELKVTESFTTTADPIELKGLESKVAANKINFDTIGKSTTIMKQHKLASTRLTDNESSK